MSDDPSFTRVRQYALGEWTGSQGFQGLQPTMLSEVIEYLLAQQRHNGVWVDEGHPRWAVVETAVVLQALARLQFRSKDTWQFTYRGKSIKGGIPSALAFLKQVLDDKSTNDLGEDIWDACQALRAATAFGMKANRHVETISGEWKNLYEKTPPTIWYGPAYYAAMIDVLHDYRADVPSSSKVIAQIYGQLKSLELHENGTPTGAFRASEPDVLMDKWNTSLVLRTLSAIRPVDHDLINRTVKRLLEELQDIRSWVGRDLERSPMFIARCLDGLRAASHLVDDELRSRIQDAIGRGHQELQRLWCTDPLKRSGSLKSYTVVGEYISHLTLQAPAELLVSAGRRDGDDPGSSQQYGLVHRGNDKKKIFLGHGRNAVWQEVRSFIKEDLNLDVEAFESESRTGQVSVDVISDLLNKCDTAVIVMAKDDNTAEGNKRARQNVIHEMGLWQGRYGFKRVIIFHEEGTEPFSNIEGLQKVNFYSGNPSSGFDALRKALRKIYG